MAFHKTAINAYGRWESIMFKCNMFPLLDTYMKALTHEQNVKPIRGTNTKPIHLRDRKYMQIAVLPNEDVVYFDGWQTDGKPVSDTDYIVKWKPNGEIHINAPMYNCIYEQLSCLLGLHFFRAKNLLWVHTSSALPLRPYKDTPTILKWQDGRLVYTNPPALTQKAVNRGVAKAVRSKYKRIYDYLRGMTKVHDEVYEYSEFVEAFNLETDTRFSSPEYFTLHRLMPNIALDVSLQRQDDIVEFIGIANEGDLTASHKLWLICAWAGGNRGGWHSDGVVCAPNQVIKAFDDFILRIHREEVFYDKEVPMGKLPSTANNKYFV